MWRVNSGHHVSAALVASRLLKSCQTTFFLTFTMIGTQTSLVGHMRYLSRSMTPACFGLACDPLVLSSSGSHCIIHGLIWFAALAARILASLRQLHFPACQFWLNSVPLVFRISCLCAQLQALSVASPLIVNTCCTQGFTDLLEFYIVVHKLCVSCIHAWNNMSFVVPALSKSHLCPLPLETVA